MKWKSLKSFPILPDTCARAWAVFLHVQEPAGLSSIINPLKSPYQEVINTGHDTEIFYLFYLPTRKCYGVTRIPAAEHLLITAYNSNVLLQVCFLHNLQYPYPCLHRSQYNVVMFMHLNNIVQTKCPKIHPRIYSLRYVHLVDEHK